MSTCYDCGGSIDDKQGYRVKGEKTFHLVPSMCKKESYKAPILTWTACLVVFFIGLLFSFDAFGDSRRSLPIDEMMPVQGLYCQTIEQVVLVVVAYNEGGLAASSAKAAEPDIMCFESALVITIMDIELGMKKGDVDVTIVSVMVAGVYLGNGEMRELLTPKKLYLLTDMKLVKRGEQGA